DDRGHTWERIDLGIAADLEEICFVNDDQIGYIFGDHNTLLRLDRSLGIHAPEQRTAPELFILHQNYPNPFNPSTTIQFDLPVAVDIRIVVYDLLGREVVRLLNQHLEPGYHQLVWNGLDRRGRPVPTGMYIVRMATPEYIRSIKMLLLK
ncbi:MAG: T9SS type A sorting domain-containing protein, partial [Candidatus Neomarinimicrobiota bacterium]